jgi:hypothetical protein
MKPVRARAGERGMALFIVVMVIVLLTAIGTFAMHATSLSQVTSGYSRRAASAFYLGEFGMNLVAASIADDPRGHVIIGSSAGANQSDCRAIKDLAPLLAVGAPAFCEVKDSKAVQEAAQKLNASLATDPEGFFGALVRPDRPANDQVSADFRVEITDHAPAPVPIDGMPMGGTGVAQSWEDAFTVSARVLPQALVAGAPQCDPDLTRASENQSFRGYVIYTTPN